MASITNQPNCRKTIQFVGSDGKRRSLRLGKTNRKAAAAFKVKVEHLVSASITGHPLDEETSRWLAGLDDVMIDRLAAVGLTSPRPSTPGSLSTLLLRIASAPACCTLSRTCVGGSMRRRRADNDPGVLDVALITCYSLKYDETAQEPE